MIARAQTDVIYSQNFDSPVGVKGDIYFTDSAAYNGITDGSSSGGITTGASFAGNSQLNGAIVTSSAQSYGTISGPQSGSYFLYETTQNTISGAADVVWSTNGLPTITVTPNTNYTFSFYLDNQDNINVAVIQPLVNGAAVGPADSAAGVNVWRGFSVVWDSGAATSANFALEDTRLTPSGNDYGIDSITVSTFVPEPRDWAMLSLLLVAALVATHRRVKSLRSNGSKLLGV